MINSGFQAIIWGPEMKVHYYKRSIFEDLFSVLWAEVFFKQPSMIFSVSTPTFTQQMLPELKRAFE